MRTQPDNLIRTPANEHSTFRQVADGHLLSSCSRKVASGVHRRDFSPAADRQILNDGELVEYAGEVEGEGHYLIRGKGFEASGTLHLADGRQLEGSWKEGQQYGMWRIYLESED